MPLAGRTLGHVWMCHKGNRSDAQAPRESQYKHGFGSTATVQAWRAEGAGRHPRPAFAGF